MVPICAMVVILTPVSLNPVYGRLFMFLSSEIKTGFSQGTDHRVYGSLSHFSARNGHMWRAAIACEQMNGPVSGGLGAWYRTVKLTFNQCTIVFRY